MKKVTSIFVALLMTVSLFAVDYWYKPTVPENKQQEYHEYNSSFALSYAEEYEQPWFVVYERTQSQWKTPNLDRKDSFRADPAIKTGSATLADYKGSGYSRGHLCPNDACNYDESTQYDCFLLSNMSPQQQNYFNAGIWLQSEQAEGNFGTQYAKSYTIVGPVFNKTNYKTLGKNKVAVPDEFYRICVFTDNNNTVKLCFAVIMSQSTEAINKHNGTATKINWYDAEFIVSIDEVEKATGLDFFPALNDSDEAKLESYKYSKSKTSPSIKFVKGSTTSNTTTPTVTTPTTPTVDKPSTNTNVETKPTNSGKVYIDSLTGKPVELPTLKVFDANEVKTLKTKLSNGMYWKNIAAKVMFTDIETIAYNVGYNGFLHLYKKGNIVDAKTTIIGLSFNEEDTLAIKTAIEAKSASLQEIAEIYSTSVYELCVWLGQNKIKVTN